jgi:hypothetical protein
MNNPSVTDFMMEQVVLSSIGSNGLAIGANIHTSMAVVPFSSPFPEYRRNFTDSPVLYWPNQFNYKAIDRMIVHIKSLPNRGKRKGKLLMCPLQIMVSPKSHSDSHKAFFDQYKHYIKDFEDFDIELRFLWITPTYRRKKVHNADPGLGCPEHVEEYVTFEKVNQDISKDYERALSQRVKQNEGDVDVYESAEEGENEEEQGGPEEPGGLGEHGGEDYRKKKVPELKDLLRQRNLSTSSNKEDLVLRLQENDKNRRS